MIWRIRFAVSALRDLEHALGALDDRRAAARIAAAIDGRIEALKGSPRLGRIVPELGLETVREVLVPPFRLVYRIERRELRVVAAVHMRRDFKGALRR